MNSRPIGWLALFLLLASTAAAEARGLLRRRAPLPALHGQLVDFTANHGADRRIWSEVLQQHRDLYVYLPPGYDPHKQYPLILWLHGLMEDEKGLPEVALADIDQAIHCGRCPPVIIAIPDGTTRTRPGLFSPHSGFINSNAGPFGDFLMLDVYPFVRTHFPIRPEREAHVLAGASIGGGAAFHHAIKMRHEFGVVIGIMPPVNFRWLDCHGRYFGNFDPDCWGWRDNYHLGLRPIGRFYGVIQIPACSIIRPLYGHGPQVIPQLSRDNPIEMLTQYGVQEGELAMLVTYGGRDEFNIDAQVESFVYHARSLGLTVDVIHDPRGRHTIASARSYVPAALDWLAVRLAPFNPDAAP